MGSCQWRVFFVNLMNFLCSTIATIKGGIILQLQTKIFKYSLDKLVSL